MKRDRLLSSALIIAVTLHLLILTELLKTSHDGLLEVLMADAMLVTLGMPALIFNGLAILFGYPVLIAFSAIAYAATILVPMRGFELFMVPAALCAGSFVLAMKQSGQDLFPKTCQKPKKGV